MRAVNILEAKKLAEFLRAETLFASRIRLDRIEGASFVCEAAALTAGADATRPNSRSARSASPAI